MYEFEWNKDKAISNLNKHKISFEEASTLFEDPFAIYHKDEFHSIHEDRYIIIGYSYSNKMLIVSFIYRNDNIRIISARLTTKMEGKKYGQRN